MWVGTTICGIHRLYIRFWFRKKKRLNVELEALVLQYQFWRLS